MNLIYPFTHTVYHSICANHVIQHVSVAVMQGKMNHLPSYCLDLFQGSVSSEIGKETTLSIYNHSKPNRKDSIIGKCYARVKLKIVKIHEIVLTSKISFTNMLTNCYYKYVNYVLSHDISYISFLTVVLFQ